MQTRRDLEFMADMLGLCEPPCARSARYGLTPTEHLARVVAEDMADPAANARAQGRIAAMLYALPHNECIQKAFALPPDRQRPAPKPWKTEANPWNVVAITPAT